MTSEAEGPGIRSDVTCSSHLQARSPLGWGFLLCPGGGPTFPAGRCQGLHTVFARQGPHSPRSCPTVTPCYQLQGLQTFATL